jgi:hypothetical protein
MWEVSPHGGELREGELLAQVPMVSVDQASVATGQDLRVNTRLFRLAFVLTQDCDLAWDFESRRELARWDTESIQTVESDRRKQERRLLTSILLCQAALTDDDKPNWTGQNDLWRRAIQNQDERYHFIAGLPPDRDREGSGLGDLIVDFKHSFAVDPSELYARLQLDGSDPERVGRRGFLLPPYRDDLTGRFYNFMGRVALPQ